MNYEASGGIINENVEQAVGLVNEIDIDLWVTLARETSVTSDPCMELIVGQDVTWHSAFLISKSGE